MFERWLYNNVIYYRVEIIHLQHVEILTSISEEKIINYTDTPAEIEPSPARYRSTEHYSDHETTENIEVKFTLILGTRGLGLFYS